jgi:hypothetical protein
MLTHHRSVSRLARQRGTFVSIVLGAASVTALAGSFAIGALLPHTVEASAATRSTVLAAAHAPSSADAVRVYTKRTGFAVICRDPRPPLLVRDTPHGWHVDRRSASAARTLLASCPH